VTSKNINSSEDSTENDLETSNSGDSERI